MTTTFHAQPYSICPSAQRFAFSFAGEDDYAAGMRRAAAANVEEFEMMCDADDAEDQAVWDALTSYAGHGAMALDLFWQVEFLGSAERVAFCFLLGRGIEPAKCLEQLEDVVLFEGTAEECAYEDAAEMSYDCGLYSFDMEGKGRDLMICAWNEPDRDNFDDDDDGEGEEEYTSALTDYHNQDETELAAEWLELAGGFENVSAADKEMYFDATAYADAQSNAGEWDEFCMAGKTYQIKNADEF